VVRIDNLHALRVRIPENSMVVTSRSPDLNSLLSSNKLSLVTRGQNPWPCTGNKNVEYKCKQSVAENRKLHTDTTDWADRWRHHHVWRSEMGWRHTRRRHMAHWSYLQQHRNCATTSWYWCNEICFAPMLGIHKKPTLTHAAWLNCDLYIRVLFQEIRLDSGWRHY